MPGATSGRSGIARFIPAAEWIRGYDRSWLPRDLIAGVTLAAYLIPAALGDATLANLPPQTGLYASLFGGAVFWLFCSSRYTAVSVTSAISLLIGSTLGEISHGDPSRFGALAAFTALLVALIAFIAWLARAGVIVNFISESVMVGFKCGVALFLGSTQLPKLFGFHGAHGTFWTNAAYFFTHLRETNPAALAMGGAALVVLVLGKIFLRTKPVALFVVAAAIAVSAALKLEAHGVSLIGAVPRGLPPLGIPTVPWADVNQLIELSGACFLLAAVETVAIGRALSAEHGGRIDPNQEVLALAAANLTAGFGRGLAVGGGSSQSLVNESGGARTPLSGAIAAGFVLIVVLFLTQALSLLPQAVLAAIVLVAVTGLFQVSAFAALRRASRAEFVVALAAFVGVLGAGMLRGVLLGAIISLIELLRRVSRPHIAVLGRIPGSQRFSDMERHPDNEAVPGVLIFRPEVSLVYFNVDGICDGIREKVLSAMPLPRFVVLDLSSSPTIDLQSAHTLAGMARELAAKGIPVHAAETHASVRDMLRKVGADAALGGVNRFRSVADAVEEFEAGIRP